MTSARRSTLSMLLLFGVLLVTSGLSTFHRLGAAHAEGGSALAGSGSGAASATPPTVPDPIAQPADALSLLESLYHSGALLCLGILLVFMSLRWARNHVAWLEVPNRAHYVSALLAGLGLLAIPAMRGTTPNLSMIIAAVGTVLALVLPGAATTMRGAPEAGFVTKPLMAFVAALGLVLGCSWFKNESKAVAADVSACAKAEKDAATANLSIVDVALEVANAVAAIAGGQSSALNVVEGLVIKYGEPIVACTITKLEAKHTTTAGVGSAGPSTARIDPVGLAATKLVVDYHWEKYREVSKK